MANSGTGGCQARASVMPPVSRPTGSFKGVIPREWPSGSEAMNVHFADVLPMMIGTNPGGRSRDRRPPPGTPRAVR